MSKAYRQHLGKKLLMDWGKENRPNDSFEGLLLHWELRLRVYRFGDDYAVRCNRFTGTGATKAEAVLDYFVNYSRANFLRRVGAHSA